MLVKDLLLNSVLTITETKIILVITMAVKLWVDISKTSGMV